MFTERPWLKSVLLIVLVVALVAAGSALAYRVGYVQGQRARLSERSATFGRDGRSDGERSFTFMVPGRMMDQDGRFNFSLEDLPRLRNSRTSSYFLQLYRAPALWFLPRVLFWIAGVGLFIFLLVQLFRPQGWRLTLGPAQPVEEKAKTSSRRSAAKK